MNYLALVFILLVALAVLLSIGNDDFFKTGVRQSLICITIIGAALTMNKLIKKQKQNG